MGTSRPSAVRKRTSGRIEKKSRVLLLGRFQELALYRAEVLRERGFDVQFSTDKERSLKLVRSAEYDVIVLSYTLSSELVERLAEEAREHCPECPLVVIASTDRLDRKIAPDAIAVADQGPPALIAALRRVLRHN
jgi:DNA-binding response OmpR family regulator